MKLFKWDAEDLKPKFENLVETIFGGNIKDNINDGEEVSTVPSVNIADENTAFEVHVALPGISKDEIRVEINHNNCLLISSEKQYEKEDSAKNGTTIEYGYASFQRMFQLPSNIDQNKVDAVMRDGILKIKVGKDESALTKKIKIDIK